MKGRRLKYIIGLVIIGCAFSYLAWQSFSASFQFSMTPGEFMAKKAELAGKKIKISGTVETGSLVVEGMDHRFRIRGEDGLSIAVHYNGVAPNTLREGADVVAGGAFDPGTDRFEAGELLTKCASKYQEQ